MMSKLRIASGLVLFAFVLGHLLTLAFGIVSFGAMDAASDILMGAFANPVGGPLLMVSFIAHGLLGIWTLFWRNTLLMNWQDGAQALLGLATVPLLLPHIMGVVVGPQMTGQHASFEWVFAVYWIFAPQLGIQQVLALIVIWIHGCYGLFLWMQVQNWWGRFGAFTYPLVVIVPVASLLGFVEGGKILLANADDQEFMAPVRETAAAYDQVGAQLWQIHDQILLWYGALILVVLAARAIRVRRRLAKVSVTYVDGPTIERKAGLSLLEIGQTRDVANAALCGGRGRCGSCAVRVIEGAGALSDIGNQEAQTLAKRSAGPTIRLACQAMPTGGAVVVETVYPPAISPSEYQALLRRGKAEPVESDTAEPEPALASEGGQ